MKKRQFNKKKNYYVNGNCIINQVSRLSNSSLNEEQKQIILKSYFRLMNSRIKDNRFSAGVKLSPADYLKVQDVFVMSKENQFLMGKRGLSKKRKKIKNTEQIN